MARDLTKEREDICRPIARQLFEKFATHNDLPLGEATDQEVVDFYNKMYVEDFLPLVIDHDGFKISYIDHLFQLMHLIVDNVKGRCEILLNQDYTKASVALAKEIFAEIAAMKDDLPFELISESDKIVEAYSPIAKNIDARTIAVPGLAQKSPSMSFSMMHSALDDLKIRAAMTIQVRSDAMTNLALGLTEKDDLTIKGLAAKLNELYAKKDKGVDK